MRDIQACVVIEYVKGSVLYPVHDLLQSSESIDFDGLLQAALEFVFATKTATLTVKTSRLPFPATVLVVENHEDGGRLTCTYYDTSAWSPMEMAELLPTLPSQWSPSKAAVLSFPQILGDAPLDEDRSLVEGYTFSDMRERDSQRRWTPLEAPMSITGFLRSLMVEAAKLESGQVVFRIPTYPVFEVQDLDKVHFKQYWLVREASK
jgi:hypothetical protein